MVQIWFARFNQGVRGMRDADNANNNNAPLCRARGSQLLED